MMRGGLSACCPDMIGNMPPKAMVSELATKGCRKSSIAVASFLPAQATLTLKMGW